MLASAQDDFLSITGLEKIYPSRAGAILAIKDVSLCVGTAEFVSLLGPSGCGKSTLLRCVAGLELPTAGRIVLRGSTVTAPPPDMGVVFQRDVLLDWLTVLRNILLPARIRGLPLDEWRHKAEHLLKMIGLDGYANRFPWELSGGMRQRVAICRALLLDPALLLMDEPFGALDALTREQIRIDLEKLWLERRPTVLFITHSISEAVALSDRIIVMTPRPGRIDHIIDVDLPRPRDKAVMASEAFSDYCESIIERFMEQGVIQY